MFVAHDQENVIHARQTTAAAKSLGGSVRGLGTRTPSNLAPKTPFKVPLNDENTFRPGKSVLRTNVKGNENFLTTAKKQGGGFDKNAFVTPAGPGTRAPLGMKTTNAKATAFQTPGPAKADPTPGKTQQKSKSPRLRRPKVKILQEAEADTKEEHEAEPEIEYMPPHVMPLPDHPEYFPPDLDLSMLEGRNFSRGMYSSLLNPEDENGMTKFEREEVQRAAEASKKTDEMLEKACKDTFQDVLNDLRELQQETTQPQQSAHMSGEAKFAKPAPVMRGNFPEPTRQPSTIASRSAASVLSAGPKSIPSFAAPTVAKTNRSASLLPKRSNSTSIPTASRNYAVATAVANSTLGYSHGRAVSTSLRPGSTTGSLHKHTVDTSITSSNSRIPLNTTRYQVNGIKEREVGKFGYKAEMELIKKLQAQSLDGEDDEEDLEDCMKGSMPDSLLLEEDTFEEFKFDMPEL